jgi:uncharacterized membrane protein YagU involved in acid resistance
MGGLLKRLLRGGLAGGVATVLMTIFMWGAKHLGLYASQPAPKAVSQGMLGKVLPTRFLVPRSGRQTFTGVSHAGFGVGLGGVYGLGTSIVPASALSGLAFGLLVWLASCMGWVPQAGLMPPPTKDERGRAVSILGAHMVYGTTLGFTMRRLAGRRRRR